MGGAERVVRTIAAEAAKSDDYDVVDIFVQCWSQTGTLDDLLRERKIRLHYASAPAVYRGMLPLLKILHRYRYSLVFSSHTHLNAILSAARRWGWLRVDRLVARESTTVFGREFRGLGRLLKFAYCLYGKQDLIVCQTERMRLLLDRQTGGRLGQLLTILPNPLDFERIEAGKSAPPPKAISNIPEDRIKVVWCGRMAGVKSPVRAIDVLQLLWRGEGRNVHLIMIGDGPQMTEVEQRVRHLEVDDRVTLTGYMQNPATVMARCDLGLVTSDREGFPNVILEMLASGVRSIVTTDCAGGLEDNAGVVVSPTASPDALAAALSRQIDISQVASPVSLRSRTPSAFLAAIRGSDARAGGRFID
jgi:glycosyltransferase involved in cell wall biosynthesis